MCTVEASCRCRHVEVHALGTSSQVLRISDQGFKVWGTWRRYSRVEPRAASGCSDSDSPATFGLPFKWVRDQPLRGSEQFRPWGGQGQGSISLKFCTSRAGQSVLAKQFKIPPG